MKTVSTLAAGIALLAGLALALNVSSAADKKVPSIEEIMEKAHDEDKGLLEMISKGLEGPKWDDVQKSTKELVPLSEALGKNKPPKGGQASWDKLTKEYATQVSVLDKAAASKDKDKASAALKTLQKSCATCHKAHKS
jgi:cytochrome c556